MSPVRIAILVVAVVAAGLAALLARNLLSDKPQAEAAPVQVLMADVLVAGSDLTPGQSVGSGQLRWQKWPVDALQSNYIVRDNTPDALTHMEGTVARVALQAGEPVTDQKVVHADKSGFLAATLMPGKRAIAVKISEETGAGGFILPNDHVDVIMTRKVEASADGPAGYQSATVLRNIRVLAIDQTVKEKDGAQVVVGKTATLELSPDQAESLALAEAMGVISLSLISLKQPDQPVEQQFDDGMSKGSSVSIVRYGVHSSASGVAK